MKMDPTTAVDLPSSNSCDKKYDIWYQRSVPISESTEGMDTPKTYCGENAMVEASFRQVTLFKGLNMRANVN